MQCHYENNAVVAATPTAVFAFLDDPSHLTAHMSNAKGSWMMGGGGITTTVDDGKGQAIGSHIRLNGKAFGLAVFLDEVVSRREPMRLKEWRTVGANRLLVIGDYVMGFELTPHGEQTHARVFIDYDLPRRQAWLGRLLGGFYARLCVDKMLADTRAHFVAPDHSGEAIGHPAS